MMSRIRQFLRNAGWIDLLRCGLIALFLGVVMVFDARDRMPPPMLPIVLLGVGLPYAFREVMYENLRKSMWAMNGTALVLIASALVAKSAGFTPPKSAEREFVYVLAGVMSLYMGCFFWLLSDPRIVRERRRLR